ncbi:serine hydrolase domain-containing protein, partial [Brevundimonas sp. FT23042]|uniref:serine hydrolase domain-containing protein n=1 Tax=Brevundimonas sp. FT23042 TaxID=3393749 RepID=UPI003B58B2E3
DAVFAAAAPPAMAAGVITDGALGWSGVRGVRRSGEIDLAGRHDRWHLGSNTKAMTAAVLARLIEQGRARWAMPLAEAFPGLTIDSGWDGLTLEDIMHHRAGLLDAPVLGRDWLISARADPRPLPAQRRALVEQVLAAPPAGPRGAFSYGNADYILIGAAIEQITGGSWEDAMRTELYGPLNLTSAGFGPPPGRDNPWGHRMIGETRTPVPPDNPGADNPAALGPAGTAHMSLGDYTRFISAMMGGAPGWLSADSLGRLTTPPAGSPPPYACGWGVRDQPWGGVGGPGPVIGHDGSNTLWHCTVAAAPQRRRAVIVLTNDGPSGQRACQAALQRLIPLAFAP